jgi:hypothetical protein
MNGISNNVIFRLLPTTARELAFQATVLAYNDANSDRYGSFRTAKLGVSYTNFSFLITIAASCMQQQIYG